MSGQGQTRGMGIERRIAGRLMIGVAAAALIASPSLGRAGETPAAGQIPTEIAQQDAPLRFDIPAQDLNAALLAFTEQAGLQVVYDVDMVADRKSSPLKGLFTPRAGLTRLLAGTGLVFEVSGGNRVTLARVESDNGQRLTLGTVSVEGRSESAWGPVEGYVATRSATATKTDASIVETPQSISVVTRDQMDIQGVQNIDQALRYSAGVVTESQGVDNRFDAVSGRGFTMDGYLDGMKFLFSSSGFTRPQIDPYMLERVELLRGPASVLYGQANPGGLFSMVSKRPTETLVRDVQLQTGSYDNKQGAFDVGGPIDDGKTLLFRLTGLAREAGTQVEHTKYQRYFVAPSFTWKPTPDTNLTLLANYQEDPKAGFFNKLPAKGTALNNEGGSVPTDFYAGDPGYDRFERSMLSAGYAFEHKFSDHLRIRQNLRYLKMDGDFAAIFAGSAMGSDGHTINRFTFTSDENMNNFTLDTQLQADIETGPLAHQFLVGTDYQWREWRQVAGSGSGPSIDFQNPVYNQTITDPAEFANQVQKQNQTGFYLQDQVKYDNWTLLMGGRWDQADSETQNNRTSTLTSQNDHAFTGRLGVSYRFATGVAPYASYTESFQPNSGTSFSGDPFEPTTGRQFEAGVKYQPPGSNMLITASVYQLTQQNVLTDDPDPSHGTSAKIATGEIRSRGAEFEATAQVTENLSLIASYSYVQPEVTRSNDGVEGKQPVGIPQHKAALWSDYRFTQGLLDGFGLGGGVRYVGESFGNDANTFKVEDVFLLDLSAHFDFGAVRSELSGLKLALNASNLLDNEYVTRCQNTGCYYGTRRLILATLNYSW